MVDDESWVPAHLRDALDDEAPPWPPDEVVPGLWQSGLPLPGEQWDAVIDLHGGEEELEDVEFYVHWRIEDGPAPDIPTLEALADMVNVFRHAGRRVLVHCHAGINRSGLVAAAALVRDGVTPDDAIATVREARSGALNNENFVAALREM